MPIPPLSVSESVPNCAVRLAYQIGELYYYDTVDCSTGDTGLGVLDEEITPEGCSGAGTCTEGSIVNFILQQLAGANDVKSGIAALVNQLVNRRAKKKARRLLGRQKFSKLRTKRDLESFQARNRPTAARRTNLVTELLNGTTTTVIEDIYDLGIMYRDFLLGLVEDELNAVRFETTSTSGSEIAYTQDRDLEVRPLPNTPLDRLIKQTNGWDITPGAQTTTTNIATEYARTGTLDGFGRRAFFRLQRAEKDGVVRYVGQQVLRLPDPAPEIVDATLVDAHTHFHVINANTADGAKDFLVYSAIDLSESTRIN